ncbi:MAG: neutral/alkaline non-lysosomal ceramidase N-terminal domain-containing protein [Planctomycetota bacterium]|nr:neutral/alkaline non-lysosomal ceramidase N-terminal domain-containing protein [Planctomycetota bacterium]
MTASLRAGVGRTDITPPLGTQLMGYGDPFGKRTATSVRDPLNATALVVEQAGKRAAVISLDLCVLDDVYFDAIRQGVQKATGIPADAVTVCVIQTHSAPRTIRAFGWCEIDTAYADGQVVPGAISAVVKAAQTVPARMGIGVVQSQTGVNRRNIMDNHEAGLHYNPWALYDPEMTVLRFESAKGPLANIVHYGAHPTVFGGSSRVISRDWPGIMIDRMEQLTKATTLFLNGAVGDIAPRTSYRTCVGDGEVALWEAGARASLDAMTAWRSVKDLRDVALLTATGPIEMPYRPLTPLAEARANLAAAEPRKDEPGEGMMLHKHWSAVIEAHAKPHLKSKTYPQILTALGPVALVPFPGEPFAETILRMRDESPFQHTLCLSTSGGHNQYFPTREAVARGGYEAWVGRAAGAYILTDAVPDLMVERNRAILREMHAKVYPALPG